MLNFLPKGYDGVDNFLEVLRDLIVEEICDKHKDEDSVISKSSSLNIQDHSCLILNESSTVTKSSTIKASGATKDGKTETALHDADSGIDTSDSCDEKKNKPLPIKAVKRQHSKSMTTIS